MKVGLIDVDSGSSRGNANSHFPNICLMKLSAWHKSQGDDVSWYTPWDDRYDLVYVSKVFTFSHDYDLCINADRVIRGGSGYAIKVVDGKEIYDTSLDPPLPPEVESMFPDYSIYGITDTAYGFLTRGCPRGCGFCHVKSKEGLKSRKVADLKDFWSGQKNIVLCDPNILACRDWKDLLQQLIDSKALVNFNQGLDIRMMTEEKAKMISRVKLKDIHFAWDRYQDKDIIVPKLKLFQENSPRKYHGHHAQVYTLVNYDTTFDEDLERIEILRSMEYYPYVMVYDKEHCDKIYRKLQRWVNNRFVFSKCETFWDYDETIA